MLSTVRQISVFCSSIHSRIVSDGPCLVLETGKFNALLDKQKRHDQLARNLKTQLDIEGRGFRSIQEELEARTQEWEEIKRDYDRELLSLKVGITFELYSTLSFKGPYSIFTGFRTPISRTYPVP